MTYDSCIFQSVILILNLLTSEDELTRPENVLLPSQDAYIRRHLHDREYRPKYRPSSTG